MDVADVEIWPPYPSLILMKFSQNIEDIWLHLYAKYGDDTPTHYEAVLYYSCKNADIYLTDVADVEISPP